MENKNFTPMRLMLLGRSGVGKTYNGMNYALQLIKKGIFKPKRVLLISMTWKSDPSQEEFVNYCQSKYKMFKESNCHEGIDMMLLQKLFNTQKIIKETAPNKLKNWLIIFDDQISSNLIKRQDKDPALKSLFCVGRHYSISQIWMLQRFKNTIDPTCRDQFTDIAIFRQGNKKALIDDLLRDYDEDPDPDHKSSIQKLYQQYQEAVDDHDGHGCLVIHCLVSYGKGRLERGLGSGKFYDSQSLQS